MAIELNNFNDFNQEEETIDIKALFIKLINNWYLFAITVLIALVVAFLFNKYTTPVYKVETTVLVQDEKGALSAQDLIGLIKALDFEVSYFSENNFISRELYKKAPFKIIFDKSHPQIEKTPFYVKITNDKYCYITVEGDNISTYNYDKNISEELDKELIINLSKQFPLNSWIESEYYKFKIVLTDNYSSAQKEDTQYYFTFNNINDLTIFYQGFSIEPINREASILKLSLEGENVAKSVDFLNKITEVYLNRGLEKKNLIATNTIEFIDNQLSLIRDSLQNSEKELQDFRTEKQIISVDFQAQQLFQELQSLQKSKAELMIKSQYYHYLKDYIANNTSTDYKNIVVPSVMGIEDPVLGGLISQLAGLYAENAELSYNSKKKNPLISINELKIRTTKSTIFENISNVIETSKITIASIDKRIDDFTNKASFLPGTQRQLFNIERRFKLQDAIYTFLMERRSDAQITKASNLPDNEVLDIARETAATPVYPKTALNYLIALLIGLIIPVAYIFGKDFFNDTINSKEDIEKITDVPVVGHILHNTKDNLVVHTSPKSSISESFRSARTNLNFIAKGKEKQTILVTSVVPGEGKSFIAENLAVAYASFGKKTLLLGFDLRKPKLYKDLNLNNTIGLTSIIVGKHTISEAVQNPHVENLNVIMAGPIPPNPAELIASTETEKIFAELKKEYDYIIIDTPPVALVTDALLLMKYADSKIFVARQEYWLWVWIL